MTQSTRRFAHRQRLGLVLFLHRVPSPFTTFVGLVDDLAIALVDRDTALERVRRSCFPCANRSSGLARPFNDARRARVHAPSCEHARVYAFAVSEDKTRPMQCRGGYTGAQYLLGERQRKRERERKKYRIVDYLKCIGNKPRRVTRCRPSAGLATSIEPLSVEL